MSRSALFLIYCPSLQLANGCTSGHGVCGLPRLSKRSFAAVGTFMATGAATAIAASRTSAFGLASVLHASTQRSPIVSSMYAAGKDVVVRPTGRYATTPCPLKRCASTSIPVKQLLSRLYCVALLLPRYSDGTFFQGSMKRWRSCIQASALNLLVCIAAVIALPAWAFFKSLKGPGDTAPQSDARESPKVRSAIVKQRSLLAIGSQDLNRSTVGTSEAVTMVAVTSVRSLRMAPGPCLSWHLDRPFPV